MNLQFLIILEILFISIFFYLVIFKYKKKIALYLKTIDYPLQTRKIHKHPTPKTGSYALAITFLLILINNLVFNLFSKDFNIIIFSSLIIFIIGLADDKVNLNPYIKIFLISIIVIFSIEISPNILITKFYLATFDTFVNLNEFSRIFTILCILLLINAFMGCDTTPRYNIWT